jgi:ribosomal protein S18 acetylase RimI-like enzyme
MEISENVKKFCGSDGKVKSWPTKNNLKQEVIEYFSTKFKYNIIYTEKEINQVIDDNHTFNDCISIRRELIDNHLLYRTNSGSKYWKASKYLDNKITTNNLFIENCTMEDLNRLDEINKNLSYLEEWTGIPYRNDYIYNSLTIGDLPPEGKKEFFRIMKIVSKQDLKIIGFIELYIGYPKDATLWIGTFYIDKEFQNHGYGHEIIEELSNNLKKDGIDEIGVGVHLKNWPALRFWSRNGFNNITGIYGDKVISPSTFSIIGLRKIL